jgi:hypothetical protein
VTLTERVLTLEEFQVNLQMCKKDFEQTWQAVEMGYSSFKNVPASFTDFIVAYAAERVAARIEQNIWAGVNASAGQFADALTPSLLLFTVRKICTCTFLRTWLRPTYVLWVALPLQE